MKIKLSQNKIMSLPVQRVLEILSETPSVPKSIRELSKCTSLSYNTTHKIVSSLSADKVIKLEKKQTHVNCILESNDHTILALSYLSALKTQTFLTNNSVIRKVAQEIKLPNVYLCLLFGSYAKGIARKESDIDLLIVTSDSKQVSLLISELSLKYGKKIDLHVYSPFEFEQEFQQKTQTVVKQAISHPIILKGHEYYWNYAIRYK